MGCRPSLVSDWRSLFVDLDSKLTTQIVRSERKSCTVLRALLFVYECAESSYGRKQAVRHCPSARRSNRISSWRTDRPTDRISEDAAV